VRVHAEGVVSEGPEVLHGEFGGVGRVRRFEDAVPLGVGAVVGGEGGGVVDVVVVVFEVGEGEGLDYPVVDGGLAAGAWNELELDVCVACGWENRRKSRLEFV